MNWRRLGKRLLCVAAVVALLLAATVAAALHHRRHAGELALKDAGALPPLAVEGLGAEDLRDQFAVVNFFASWCAPCVAEHPKLVELSQHLPVYGIAYSDSDEATDKFLERHGNPFTKLGRDREGGSGGAWNIIGLPTTLVINREGHIIYRRNGGLTGDDVRGIEALAAQQKPAETAPIPAP